MRFIFGLLLLLLSLEAKKCDNYVVGAVWFHKGQTTDESGNFEGCKKGCFWNDTYTDDGVRKCEKCSDIEDEETCLANSATCVWKKDKCKSQSCPGIAKAGVTVGGPARTNPTTRIKDYRYQVRRETECLERSALEQNFSKEYWADYQEKANYQFFQDNCPNPGYQSGNGNSYPQPWSGVDSCTDPCSAWGSLTNIAEKTEGKCVGYFGGCIFIADTTNPRCIQPDSYYYCSELNNDGNACLAYRSRGCVWTAAVEGVSASHCDGQMTDVPAIHCDGFTPGVNNELTCDRIGCTFTPGSNRLNDTCEFKYDSYNSRCAGFKPGEGSAKCVSLGCTYNPMPNSGPLGVGCGEFQSDCPSKQNSEKWLSSVECATNDSLYYNNYDVRPCDDKLPETQGGTLQNKQCRLMIDIARDQCKFDYEKLKGEVLFINGKDATGGLKPGTKYELCLQNPELKIDPDEVESDGSGGIRYKALTEENRFKIFGYRTAEEYCDHEKAVEFERCEVIYYNNTIQGCHGIVTDKAAPAGSNHGNTMASRAACHRVYGCMYSKSNERCSVWSVWAFILTLILTIVVFVVAVGVVAVVLLPILKKSAA